MPIPNPPILLDPSVYPDTSLLITEDGKPVDNLFVEKQYRLLTEPLWSSWKNPEGRPFRVLANVGLFFQYKQPPLVPDVMFAIDVKSPKSTREKDNRSYFMWVVGKPPDVVIEIVSDKRGGEDTDKLKAYQRIKIPFYVIFDPFEVLDSGPLRAFGLHFEKYMPVDPVRLGDMGLGLQMWEGAFEDADDNTWLRWIDADGVLVPTGKERADAEAKRTKAEAKRAKVEAKRADAAEERIKQLEAKLRSAGIAPNGSK